MILSFALLAFLTSGSMFDNQEMTIAQPPMSYYAPVPDFHNVMQHGVGVISAYTVGPTYTQAVVFDTADREYAFVVGGDFTMEGHTIRCQQAPSQDDDEPVSPVVCPDWPEDITLDQTPVAFTYWKTRLGDHEIAVLRSVDRFRGPVRERDSEDDLQMWIDAG